MKRQSLLFKTILHSFALLTATCLLWQTGVAQENPAITQNEKQIIFKKAVDLMNANYIFPGRVKKIESMVQKKFSKGEYDKYDKLFDFLEVLNKDFEQAGEDHHLNIFYGPAYVKKLREAEKNSSASKEQVPKEFVNMITHENFFLRKVERLDGNIGYFKFNKFEELQFSRESIASAMNFISNSSAIVIDLTQNGGGSAETVHFLMNYFLPDSTKLGEFKRRINDELIELWTTKDPIIKKIPDSVPLFISVSKNTSSAAEAFAYGLQQFNRAVVIGEQTRGEANPGKWFVVNDLLRMMIPTATNTNVKTGTNWEGTGVIPDIKTDPSVAMQQAVLESYRVLANLTSIDELKQLYQWKGSQYQSLINPLTPSTGLLQSITGDYGEGRKIEFHNCSLYYVNKGGKYKMTYMNANVFAVEGKDFRLKFPDAETPAFFYEAFWMDGGSEKVIRMDKK